MFTAMPIALPQEMLDMVAEALHPADWHEDGVQPKRQDLSSFSLVCRAWRAIGQAHLFRDVTYRIYDSSKETRPVLKTILSVERRSSSSKSNADCEQPHDVVRTLEMFQSFAEANPALVSNTIRLKLFENLPQIPKKGVYVPCPPSSTDPLLFCQVLSLLPRLRELELTNINVSGCSLNLSTCPIPTLRSISRLRLHFTYHKRMSWHIGDVLPCFDGIGTLEVGSLPLPPLPTSQVTRCLAPRDVSITTLVCTNGARSSELDGLFDHLRKSTSIAALRSLSIRSSADSSPSRETFFRTIGPGLQHLTCICLSMALPLEWIAPTSGLLKACLNLTSLTLYCRDTGAIISPLLMERFISVLQPCLSLKRLTSFVLCTTWYGVEVLPAVDKEDEHAIEDFEDVLIQIVESTALKAVCLMSLHALDEDTMVPLSETEQAVLAGYLPRLYEHGWLRFSV